MSHKISSSVIIVAICFVSSMFFLQSCSHHDELMKNGKESTATDHSHNAGTNCMSCHHDNSNEASGKWWYFAGTVYNDSIGSSVAGSSGYIELWTDSLGKGTRLYRVPVDKAGNFYTEKIIDFKGGFYPVFVSNNNVSKYMKSKTIEGSCSSCHGVSQNVISAN